MKESKQSRKELRAGDWVVLRILVYVLCSAVVSNRFFGGNSGGGSYYYDSSVVAKIIRDLTMLFFSAPPAQ